MTVHTVVGAGGAIGNRLVPILLEQNEDVRLVSRSGRPVAGAEVISSDATDLDAMKRAIKGSSVVYLLVGLPYDIRVWRTQWPTIMSNVIEACKEASARLLFLDNVYMYGRAGGTMTEETPFRPVSQKGEVRAAIAEELLDDMRAGRIDGLIARSADFYGPGAERTSVPHLLVIANLARGRKAQWPCNADMPHSLTYAPDAARALSLLAQRDDAFGQTWHLPTSSNPLTGRQFASAAAAAMGRPDGVVQLPRWMIRVGGLFSRAVKESVEMAYQYEAPYVFDSSKFNQAFGYTPVAYADGVVHTVESLRD